LQKLDTVLQCLGVQQDADKDAGPAPAPAQQPAGLGAAGSAEPVDALVFDPVLAPCTTLYNQVLHQTHPAGLDAATCAAVSNFCPVPPKPQAFTQREAETVGHVQPPKGTTHVFKSREDQKLNELFTEIGVSLETANVILSTLVKASKKMQKLALRCNAFY